MSFAHEIITIQAGNYSNFIGSHFWNIQESSFCYSPDSLSPIDINHDVLFREGLNLRGEVTYTPRLVLIDLEQNLTSISKQCPLYKAGEDESKTLWDGPVEVVKDPICRRNPFLEEFDNLSKQDSSSCGQEASFRNEFNFNSTSTVWCDYLKTNLHPRSFCLLESETSSSEKNPVDLFSCGEEIYLKCGREIIEESLRKMTEECDGLQGFHLIFDSHNGFAGINSQVLEHLCDEYKRIPSICFPVYQDYEHTPVLDTKKQHHRLYAILKSMNDLTSNSSFFSPLSLSEDIVQLPAPKIFPFLEYDESIMYQSSAILAASIETLTSPYRLKNKKFSMWDVAAIMSTYNRKLVCSSACLPFPISHDAYLSSMIAKDVQEYYMTPLTPFYKPQCEKTLFQTAVLRGVALNRFQNLGKSAYQRLEPEEVFGDYLNKYSPSSVTTATVFPEMCSVQEPFPRLFKSIVGDSGYLNELGVSSKRKDTSKVPVAASFSSADSSGAFIEDLLSQARKLSFREYVKCSESTYEKDDYQETIENLIGLQDNYNHY